MSHSKRRTGSSIADRSIIETAPKASFIMLFSGLFLLLIMTAASANAPSPTALSPILAPISLLLGIGVGGAFCGIRLQGTEAYACAAISAALLTVLLLALKLLISAPEECLKPSIRILLHLLTIAAAILGAIISSKLPQRKRRKKSKHRS